MAHSADVLTLEEAHWRVMSKITEVERFLQRHTTIGSLHLEQWAEAGDLQQKLAHRLSIMKILWHAEPDEARFHGMRDWITVIEDKVRTKLRAMDVFVRVRERRLLNEHNAGVQITPDPAGGGVLPWREEATTNTTTGLNIDTAGRRKTLTRQAGDTGEPHPRYSSIQDQ